MPPTESERHVFIPAPSTTDEERPQRSNAVREFYKRNEGLFIIAASQFFFSLMNLSVKVLTVLDKPVPTFEVGSIFIYY